MNLNITNEDCMALMARTPDGYYDLCIADPPYGIDAAGMGMSECLAGLPAMCIPTFAKTTTF